MKIFADESPLADDATLRNTVSQGRGSRGAPS